MKMKMNNLKDKVYELEGLLELQALRPDKKDDLRHLIDGRIKEINAIWAELSRPGKKEDDVPAVSAVAETENIMEIESGTESVVETESEPEASIYSVPVDDVDVSVTMDSPRVPRPEVSAVSGDAPRAVPALCLNDRFQFTRVIAGGDRAAFDKILKKVSELPDYDAARDYVLGECHADPDDPEVMDFLEILQQYYE